MSASDRATFGLSVGELALLGLLVRAGASDVVDESIASGQSGDKVRADIQALYDRIDAVFREHDDGGKRVRPRGES